MTLATNCKRCTHDLENEEKYFLFGNYYCLPCADLMTHDPEYEPILKKWGLMNIET